MKYTGASATDIALDLMTRFAVDVTANSVEADLPIVDEISFPPGTTLADALSQLATAIGGFWYVDYVKDLHFYLDESGIVTDPTPLTIDHPTLANFSAQRDLSNVVTRVFVKGGGASAAADTVAGATSLRVDSADWYNTSGGTVVCGPQRITYTGVRTAFDPSSAWSAQTPAEARDWRAVAWSPSLGLFAAVALDGSTNHQVMTSPDGITWTLRSSPQKQWISLCWSPALSLFVAVAFDSGVDDFMTSPDGITWTSRNGPASTSRLWDVCWSPAQAIFVAVSDSTNQVLTSPDGTTWTARTSAATKTWEGVCWSPELSLFVAVAFETGSATSAVMTSPDGITWTARNAAAAAGWCSVCWSPELSLFVAVAGDISTAGAIMTSPDGTTWTSRTMPDTGVGLKRVTWSAELGLFIAVGAAGSTPRVLTSADGISWTAATLPGTGTWYGVAWSPTLATVVVVGDDASTLQVLTNVSTPFTELTGIPDSGDGAILYAISQGDTVNLLVQADDTDAQATLAALFDYGQSPSPDGVIEEYITVSGVSETEATARGAAELARYSTVPTQISYTCRDPLTHVGRTISVDLPSPTNVSGDFTITDVIVTFDEAAQSGLAFPLYTVEAGPLQLSLGSLLQRTLAAATGRG